MGWEDVVSLVAGGAKGYQDEANAEEKRQLQERALELKLIVEQLKQEGQTGRTTQTNQTREAVAGNTNATRERIAGETNTTRRDIAGQASADRRYATDTRDSQYWDSADRWWEGLSTNDATRRRGQDISAETTRRGQSMTQGTAQRGQDLGHEDRAMGYAIGAYGRELQRRRDQAGNGGLFGPTPSTGPIPSFNDWLRTSDDPEIFPSVRRNLAPDPNAAMYQANQAAAQAPASAAPAAAPPVVAPPGAGPKPAMPPPRQKTAAPPAGLVPGATVKLKDGRQVVVKKVHPDGTFEY